MLKPRNHTKLFQFILISVMLALPFCSASLPCTTAIIAGRYTVDGRPLLFKHRDTRHLANKLMFFRDGKYQYIGLVNTCDKKGQAIWAGYNSAGFAIMNSAFYNLNTGKDTSLKDQEGIVMKKALQTCATLADFEQLLQRLPKPLGVEANFGVIDAQGGAAYYETGNYSFQKFDANDPTVAPFGYLIRTNFSFRGRRQDDKGLIRYHTAEQLFHRAATLNQLSCQFLLQDVSRCLQHSLTHRNLLDKLPRHNRYPVFVDFRDFIPRYCSSAVVVVQGIKKGERASLTTMWTVLGFPFTAVALPTWVAAGPPLPSVLTADQSSQAPLCALSLQLKKRIFPLTRGAYRYYIDLAALSNQEHTGIWQKLAPLEKTILQQTRRKLQSWRTQGSTAKQIHQFYRYLDTLIKDTYEQDFALICK